MASTDFITLAAHTTAEVLALPHVGETSLRDIREQLHTRGVWLRGDRPSPE